MVHVKSRLRRSEPVMNHGYTCALSAMGPCIRFVGRGRYRLRRVWNRDIHVRCTIFTMGHDESCHEIYSILFTVYNRPSDHEISRCCLHFKRNVFGVHRYENILYEVVSLVVSWKDRARLMCIEFMLSEFLSNLPYIFHLSRLFFLLLFFSSPLSTFLNAVLAINHLCCTHYCRNFYRCS